MLTILSMLGGFLVRLLPSLLGFATKWLEARHELNMMKLSVEISRMELERALKSADMKYAAGDAIADKDYAIEMRKLVNATKTERTKFPFIDAINSSVRTIVTIWFLLIYTWIKYVVVQNIGDMYDGVPLFIYINALFGEEDMAMLGAIIGYHFSAQAMKYVRS